jgi:hypothetical protein
MMAKTAALPVATTTASTTAPARSARATPHLRFDISKLRDRLASTTLDISALMAPKTDVAIPKSGQVQTGASGTFQGTND